MSDKKQFLPTEGRVCQEKGITHANKHQLLCGKGFPYSHDYFLDFLLQKLPKAPVNIAHLTHLSLFLG